LGEWVDVVNIDSVKNQAVIQCLSKVNPSKSQSLVTLLELRKTYAYLATAVTRFAKVAEGAILGKDAFLSRAFPKRRAPPPKHYTVWNLEGGPGSPVLRRGNKVVKRYGHAPTAQLGDSPLERVMKLWLEYRYAISPLVYDIVDTLKAINELSLRQDLLKREIYFAKGASRDAGRWSENRTAQFGGGTHGYHVTVDHEVKAKAYAAYRENLGGLPDRLNDFGAFDVPRALWEITPWSFVIDWIIPIGEYLAAVTPKFGIDMLATGVALENLKTVRRQIDSYSFNGDPAAIGSWPSPPLQIGLVDGFTARGSERVVPLPVPKLPTPDVNLNVNRLLDAIALAKGVYSRSTLRI
jgi:hypothetical protein